MWIFGSMNVLRTLLYISFFVSAFCQNVIDSDTEIESSSQTTLIIVDEDSESNNSTDPTEAISSSASTTENEENATKSSIDNSDDIVITAVPKEDETDITTIVTTDDLTSTTVYDDDITTIDVDQETNGTVCFHEPCLNGGTCIPDPFISTLFSCICPEGHVGIRCETRDNCVENLEGQLCKDGACFYSKDGLERHCRCFTGTYWDEDNSECREPDLPCFPNPCLNGGTCSSKDDLVLCDCPSGFQGNNCSVHYKCGDCTRGTCVLDDKRTAKICKCNEGLYWSDDKQTCEEMVSLCDTKPCLNGGTCDAISDTAYNCTCDDGFSGTTCDIVDKCSTHEDCVHGACMLSEDKKLRTCHCDKGFYLEEQEHTCEEITNSCQPNPCMNAGICTVISSNSYNCTCSEGYTGVKCDIRDFCKMNGGDAYCRNGVCNNFELGVYYCTCDDDEYFQYSERKCVELDLCPLMHCEDTEECSMGKCECKENYKWNNNPGKCEANFCASNPCPASEMKCKEGTGSTDFECSCQHGYAFNGTHCNEAICIFPSLNDCDQICSSTHTGYECSCQQEFELTSDNHTCSYNGNYTCSNKTCDKGFCNKKNGKEVCLCSPGYVEKNGTCVDICNAGQLKKGICPAGECESQKEDGYRCKCEGKFALSDDKSTCMRRSVCKEKEIGWKTCKDKNAECLADWLSTHGFTCLCGKGQVQTADGVCRDVCSLENNQRQCSIKRATCDVDSGGRMICNCPPYFKENERDGICSQPADYSYLVKLPLDKSTYEIRNRRKRSLDASIDYRKISADVTVTMQEMFTDFKRAYALSCKSAPKHMLCKIELQFTREHKTDLKRLEIQDICLTDGDSNTCLLPPKLVLVKDRISIDVNIEPTNPCDEDISDLVCGSETTCTSSLSQKSFNCSCKPGFYSRKKVYQFGNTRSFIESCADIDECVEGDPCPANSNCENTIGNYTCSCKPGFRSIDDTPGSNAQKCVEICRPNPCIHGECSTRGDHEFDCRCEAGYRGTFCNLQDENFKRARINTIIVGVVLGGILLITFILFAACVSRLRKKKYLENPGHTYYNSTEMTERRRVEGGVTNNAFQRE